VFAKSFVDLDNARLRRLCEKVQHFNFSLTWAAGKEHQIADALSRAPTQPGVSAAAWEDLEGIGRNMALDKSFNFIREASREEEYRGLAQAIRNNDEKAEQARPYKKIFAELSVHILNDTALVMWGNRVVIPAAARKRMLEILHLSHSGVVKTSELAKTCVYWPGMTSDIASTVAACKACRARLPSQQKEPMDICEARYPMEKVGVDLFETGGQKWLVLVDRYSGYIWTKQMQSTTTRAVTNALSHWFCMFGRPKSVRTDGGPQFRSEFSKWCDDKNISHELASAYNPNSNGLAEAAVKTAKYLVEKCKETKQDFNEALLESRCTPRADGISPAEAMFGRRLRSAVPRVDCSPGDKLQRIRAQQQKVRHDQTARNARMDVLRKGDKVQIQNPTTGRWEDGGVISGIRESGKSYHVQFGDWAVVRSRKFLRKEFADKKVAERAD